MAIDEAALKPSGIPDDYEQIVLQTREGKSIVMWGRVTRRVLPDGSEEIAIEDGIIAE